MSALFRKPRCPPTSNSNERISRSLQGAMYFPIGPPTPRAHTSCHHLRPDSPYLRWLSILSTSCQSPEPPNLSIHKLYFWIKRIKAAPLLVLPSIKGVEWSGPNIYGTWGKSKNGKSPSPTKSFSLTPSLTLSVRGLGHMPMDTSVQMFSSVRGKNPPSLPLKSLPLCLGMCRSHSGRGPGDSAHKSPRGAVELLGILGLQSIVSRVSTC